MDNDAHLHLLVNHFPIIAPILAVPLLVLTLILRKERGLLLASVFLLVATAIGGWLSVETGERAMDELDAAEGKKWYATYDETFAVGEHEERAEKAMPVVYATAALGLVVLFLAHRRKPEEPLGRLWIALLLLGAGATAGAMGWVGNAGGVIMHREIRGDALDTTSK